MTRPALLLFGLLMLQLALGTLSYMAKYTTVLHLTLNPLVLITTTHLAVGALMLAASAALTLRAFHLSAWSRGHSGRKFSCGAMFLYEIHHGNRQYRDYQRRRAAKRLIFLN